MSKRVLVTAGASGIGWAITQAFLAEGDEVHIFDIDQQAVDKVLGTHEKLSGSTGDVSSEEDVAGVAKLLEDQWGGLDVLVNNAGVAGPTAPIEEYDLAAWKTVVDVNLTGSFNVVGQMVPLLKKGSGGSILVMSSLAGRFGYANRIAYSATKWGLVGFTKTLSLELGPHNITVNSIHPGAVKGERINQVFEGRAKLSGRSVEDEKNAALENQSVKAFTDPADIGALAVFLSGPHARTISGQQFPIGGDSRSAQ